VRTPRADGYYRLEENRGIATEPLKTSTRNWPASRSARNSPFAWEEIVTLYALTVYRSLSSGRKLLPLRAGTSG
jgi:hypothetical protein